MGARARPQRDGKDVLIVDTSGRLHVDEELMAELVRIRDAVQPRHVLLVLDAMTGQDAVNVAEQFAAAVDFDGVRDDASSTATPAGAPRCRCGRSPSGRSCSPPPARSSSSSNASTPTAWPSGSSAWAT